MKHLPSILWLISWPLLIYITYKGSQYFIKLFEKNSANREKAEGDE